jgi:hypothetical protein
VIEEGDAVYVALECKEGLGTDMICESFHGAETGRDQSRIAVSYMTRLTKIRDYHI